MSEDRSAVVRELEKLLADTYTLYVKSHSYHWNVTGPQFTALHTLFETHYTELALAVDEIAERIRALGAPAPGSFRQFTALATVKDDPTVPAATEMICRLVADHETVVTAARRVVGAGEGAADDASLDLGVRRIDVHEKVVWMLRSHLE